MRTRAQNWSERRLEERPAAGKVQREPTGDWVVGGPGDEELGT